MEKEGISGIVSNGVGMWHLRKEISVGHIISTVLLTILLVGGWVDIQERMTLYDMHISSPAHEETEKRLDAAEATIARVVAIDAAIQIRLEDIQKEIIRRLDRQDIKLDRIEDRLNQHDSNKK
jgi:hypothetical protein